MANTGEFETIEQVSSGNKITNSDDSEIQINKIRIIKDRNLVCSFNNKEKKRDFIKIISLKH